MSAIEKILKEISANVRLNITDVAKQITEVVMESMKSGPEVGQKTVSKMKKRKLRSVQVTTNAFSEDYKQEDFKEEDQKQGDSKEIPL